MKRWRTIIPSLAAIGLVALWAASGRAEQLTGLEGVPFSADITGIDAGGQVQLANGPVARVDLQSLRRIGRSTDPVLALRPAVMVYLKGGGALFAQRVTLHDAHASIERQDGSVLKLPTQTIRGLWMQVPEAWYPSLKPDNRFMAALADKAPMHSDRIFVLTDQGVQSIGGLLENIGPHEVHILYANQDRVLPPARFYGVVLARTGEPFDPTGQCFISLRDGSTLWAQVRTLQGQTLTLAVDGTQFTVPWDSVARLDVRSRRMVFLSDLDPVAETQDYFPTGFWKWQRDKAVSGQPLVLAGQVYEKGLGMHARCALTYDLGGRYDALAATIGVQPPVPGKGDCEFVVSGDGRELFRQRLTGGDAPQPIRVSVTGVQRLTLTVDPGGDLDLADHADWAGARLIRDAK